MDGEILRRAYARIGDSTSMLTDCGLLCGAACCHTDEDGRVRELSRLVGGASDSESSLSHGAHMLKEAAERKAAL